ncbi:hypothetical protein B0H16DRAFT_1554858 [Mycena metata]|uniref:F-box domain-containing protein n=1 Tax=Mycena metata TaxID=1033252 RepID=A0AAD7HJV7_9AGAR|nr:hypothetical protein B0H16DRAFT_1600512 [Mycena metata]KAJ7747857.1 hypothetical protein B0H16DRAFT_1554858 [Mycena metata]
MSSEIAGPPISNVPTELLCNIFTLTLRHARTTDPIPVVGPHRWGQPWVFDCPWNLTQVCSYWRTLAISMPQLWTYIIASTNIAWAELSLLNIQLARTQNAPLDVIVRFASGQYSLHRDGPFVTFWRTLLSHSARWRTLHFQFDTTWGPHGSFWSLKSRSLSSLEELDEDNFLAKLPLLCHDSPGKPEASPIRGLSLPWAQLKRYTATYHSPNIHYTNLAAMPNLVECEINFAVKPNQDMPRHSILTLPRLRRLALSHPLFLARLAAPILQTLHIQGSAEEVLPFLLRSGFGSPITLTELRLLQCASPAPDVIEILRHTPRWGSEACPQSSWRHSLSPPPISSVRS